MQNTYTDQIKKDLQKLEQDIMAASTATGEQVKEYAYEAGARVREEAGKAMQKAREKGEQANEFAHENPWLAAAIAAIIGFVIGMLSSRGRSR